MADRINSDSVAQDQILAFVQRIERIEAEVKELNSDKSEIFAEAKGNGFDTKVLRQLIRIRKIDHNERMEQEALLDLYMAALGMAPAPGDDGDDDYDPPRRAAVQPEHRADATGLRQIGSVASSIVADLSPSLHEGQETHPARAASNSQAERRPESTEQSAGANADERAPVSSAAIQPETATEKHVLTPSQQTGPAVSQHSGEAAVDPVRTLGEHDKVSPDGEVAADATGSSNAPVAPSTKLKMNAEFFDEPHPACQRPGFCGGNSNVALCEVCKAAAGQGAQVEAEHRVLN